MHSNQFIFTPISLAEIETAFKNAVAEILAQQGNKPHNEHSELITREQTAELLRVSLPTLHNWTKSGLLQSYKIASRVRYKREEVMRIFQNGELKRYGRHSQ